jgi:uncharacterized membrane protein YfcA
MEILINYDFTTIQWAVVIMTSFIVGIDKSGLPTLLIIIPLMAQILGGKLSAGFLLPLLVIGDIFAVIYYKRHTEIKILFKLLPWALLGVVIGLFVGSSVSDAQFKMIIGIIVLICVVLLISKKDSVNNYLSEKWYFHIFMGILGGFASMIGNAAGPIVVVYFLSMNLNKNSLIGTMSWFFFILNLIKLPLYAFVWHNITLDSFLLNLMICPLILVGGFIGVRVVKLVPEKSYRIIMIGVTIIGAVRLIA